MKDIKKWGFSILMFGIAMLLTVASRGSHNIEKIILLSVIAIAVGGVAIALTIAVWSKKNRKSFFTDSLKFSFGLSALLFICGYLFTALHPVILK